ncbi:MAG: DUF4286 family protein [Chitinophagaceae bacterium]
MLIYNVTSQVNHNISAGWLNWMKTEHIPEVLSTGMFTHHRLVKLLETDETEGFTYAIQYFCNTREQYEQYINNYAPALRKKALDRWGTQFIAFRTLMEVIN